MEAQQREQRELEARRARSARRREDWLVEQESLRAEMRQMLDMQREQAVKIERQEAQREEEHGKLEQELRDAIEKQQSQSSEDAAARATWETQNQKLRDEASVQSQIAEIAQQLAEQSVAQQTTLENNAAQQELAEELRTAIKSHTDILQEVHNVLGEARALGAQEEAEETAATNQQLLEEIHQSLESHKAVLREAQSQSEVSIQGVQSQIAEALAARAVALPDVSADGILSALHEKREDSVEANESLTATLRANVGQALAPLTQHIKDIECRQEELSELLIEQKKKRAEDDELSKSSAALDAMARQEAAQERLVHELHQGLELQKSELREARSRAEPAIRTEVELALARNDASVSASQQSLESEVQQALEKKQREVVETNRATAAALQRQVAEALAPLTRHIKDVERRQDDDVLRVQADGERSRAQLETEFRKAREAQDRSIQMQMRMESSVQTQMSQAFEVFKVQLRDTDRARTDDLERMKQEELTRKLINEEHEAQRRQERAALLQLQEAEIQQRERRRENDRLAEELHQAHESELQRREADLRKELEWKVEKRSMQFRDEHREMMFKSEFRQLEWQVDWQAVQLLEDSDLLRPSSAQSSRRTRSQSRVRENLFNALAASRENLAFAGQEVRSSDAEDPGDDPELFPEGGRLQLPLRVGRAKQSMTHRSSRPCSSNSRRSRRPASAAHSDRSLAAEIAADLASDPPRSRANSSRRSRQHHSQEVAGAMPHKQHSSRWYDMQHARQSDQQLLKSGGRSGTNGPVALTLDDIYRAYPEVSQIISLG